MAAFTEVAKLVFVGDDKQMRSALRRMENDTKKTTQTLERFGSVARRAFMGIGAASAGLIALYAKQEQAELQVAAAIKQMGKAHELSVADVKAMASELQATSTYGDEAALAAANLGLRLGALSREQMPRFLRLSADFATSMGKDLPEAARQLSRYLADPTQGMTRLAQAGITLDKSTQEYIRTLYRSGQEIEAQNALLAQLESRFAGASKAAIDGTGVLKQTMNTLGDLGESVGKILFEAIEPTVRKFQEFLQTLKGNDAAIQRLAEIIKYLLTFTAVAAAVAATTKALVAMRAAVLALAVAFRTGRVAATAFWGAATLGVSAVITEIILNFDKLKEKVLGTFEYLENKYHAFRRMLDSDYEPPQASPQRLSDDEANAALLANKKRLEAESAALDQEQTQAEAVEVEKRRAQQIAEFKAKEEAARAHKEKEKQARETEKQQREQERIERQEIEREKAQIDHELEMERLNVHLTDKSELEKQHAIEMAEWQAEFDAAQLEKDQEKKSQELERLSLQKKLIEKTHVKDVLKQKKFDKKIASDKLKSDFQLLAGLLGQRSAAGKAMFALQKAMAIRELLLHTPANAAAAYTKTAAAYPYPFGKIFGALAYGLTWAQGMAGVASARSAERGALVEGNPSLGDVHPYMLQAGEVVVPRTNYADIEQGIRSRIQTEPVRDETAAEPQEVDVRIEMTDEAAKLIQIDQTALENLGL